MPLAWNRYGKAQVGLVKVRRLPDRDALMDLTVDVQLEGAFESVYVDGNNDACVATDTMKNTVYAFAREDRLEHIESFCDRLAGHFFGKAGVSRAILSLTEHRWEHVTIAGAPHPRAFVQPGTEQWTTVVTRDAAGTVVVSGLTGLVVLKTSDSGFSGFPRDRFTTLPETDDRILATSVTASWKYRQGMESFAVRTQIRQALVETFAAHHSRSVQHTLYAMAQAALDRCSDVVEITLRMPNRHHILVDLQPFGLDNPNDVFVATEQPYGLIEATVSRAAR